MIVFCERSSLSSSIDKVVSSCFTSTEKQNAENVVMDKIFILWICFMFQMQAIAFHLKKRRTFQNCLISIIMWLNLLYKQKTLSWLFKMQVCSFIIKIIIISFLNKKVCSF